MENDDALERLAPFIGRWQVQASFAAASPAEETRRMTAQRPPLSSGRWEVGS